MARKFNGKRYDLYDAFRTKKLAQQYARDLRKMGDLVRVIDTGVGIL